MTPPMTNQTPEQLERAALLADFTAAALPLIRWLHEIGGDRVAAFVTPEGAHCLAGQLSTVPIEWPPHGT